MRLFRHGLRNGFSMACLALALFVGGPVQAADSPNELPWIPDLQKGLEAARKSGRNVFVDFTGESCINCKLNEKNAFPLPQVRERLLKFELVQLYTDIVPNKYYSPEERKKFGDSKEKREADAEKNQELLTEKFKGGELPLYVILKPRKDGYDEIARYTKGRIVGEKTNDVAGFVAFLDKGLAGTRSTDARPPAPSDGSKTSPGKAPATANLIDFDVKVEPAAARRGEIIRLIIRGRPREGYHTYPLTMRSSQQDPVQLSRLNNPGNKDLKPLWPVAESDAEF